MKHRNENKTIEIIIKIIEISIKRIEICIKTMHICKKIIDVCMKMIKIKMIYNVASDSRFFEDAKNINLCKILSNT